jgi:hypothetical protein
MRPVKKAKKIKSLRATTLVTAFLTLDDEESQACLNKMIRTRYGLNNETLKSFPDYAKVIYFNTGPMTYATWKRAKKRFFECIARAQSGLIHLTYIEPGTVFIFTTPQGSAKTTWKTQHVQGWISEAIYECTQYCVNVSRDEFMKKLFTMSVKMKVDGVALKDMLAQ